MIGSLLKHWFLLVISLIAIESSYAKKNDPLLIKTDVQTDHPVIRIGIRIFETALGVHMIYYGYPTVMDFFCFTESEEIIHKGWFKNYTEYKKKKRALVPIAMMQLVKKIPQSSGVLLIGDGLIHLYRELQDEKKQKQTNE